MHFDDRLDTVLSLPAMGKAFARIQYRQLLDILGSFDAAIQGPQIDSAYRRLAELSAMIPADERAAMLRPSIARLRSPRLLKMLAQDEPCVASAAIAMAQVSEEDWLALIPALPVRARGILRHRRGLGARIDHLLEKLGISDRGLPPAEIGAVSAIADREKEEPLELVDLAPIEGLPDESLKGGPQTGDEMAERRSVEPGDDIATLLRRIEEFSKARRKDVQTGAGGMQSPRLPLEDHDEEARAKRDAPFDFATDAEGRIVWADAAVAPMVVGLRLATPDRCGALSAPAQVEPALRRRQPLRAMPVSIDGAPAVSGDWQVDAAPRFDPQLGGFTGYAGRFRRPAGHSAEAKQPEETSAETDRIRQLLHELRTPANAIQISAEIIQQNLFGPTPHEYRAIAAMIASDTAYVLAGFDELERLAKLEGNAIEMEPGTCDIATVIRTIVGQLQAYTSTRESGFTFDQAGEPVQVGLAEAEAERLVWRLLATLAGKSAPDERLALSCGLEGDQVVLAIELPAALAARDDEALFRARARAGTASAPRTLSAGMFGTGFSLRLARAEAQAAGGSLKRDGNHLRLALPALTALSPAYSLD